MNENVKNIIIKLADEMDNIANIRKNLIDQLNQIDIRIHQITGALAVLKQLEDTDEGTRDNQPV